MAGLAPHRPTGSLRVAMLLGSVAEASGGVSEAVRSLALALSAERGVHVEIVSLREPDRRPRDFAGLPVHLLEARGPASFGYAPDLARLLEQRGFDLVHVHGLWMHPSVAVRQWARRTGRPYLVSPHGMLDPWALANSAWKKRIAWQLFERRHLAGAACLHALCEAERAAISALGLNIDTFVVPNGVAALPSQDVADWRRRFGEGARILLFLGRITPKKRVVELAHAWSRARPAGSPWRLVIVGPAAGEYENRLRELAGSAEETGILLAGAAYGPARAASYASADAFVLPSVSEGLPMAVLEAFAAGLPVLMTRQCNLPEGFAAGAAIEIGADEAGIERGLRQLFSMSDDRRAEMGGQARRLAAERFDWAEIAGRFASRYAALCASAGAASRTGRVPTGRAGLPA
ncbi:glycosyltransferase [Afifella sp. IM 167]|uniref:glycosyltransferase n=1 Tax=Afifella sp. IM 167 TaxID=2033586 RepID=UPI001CCF6B80|nr:glycosyltransferase [Afifella sp. IM 167]